MPKRRFNELFDDYGSSDEQSPFNPLEDSLDFFDAQTIDLNLLNSLSLSEPAEQVDLFSLIRNGASVQEIESAISNGADVNAFDDSLRTPLELAMELERKDVITYLEQHPLVFTFKQEEVDAMVKILKDPITPKDLYSDTNYSHITSTATQTEPSNIVQHNQTPALTSYQTPAVTSYQTPAVTSYQTPAVTSYQTPTATTNAPMHAPSTSPLPIQAPFQGPYAATNPQAPNRKTRLHELASKSCTQKNAKEINDLIATPSGRALINQMDHSKITPLYRAVTHNNINAIGLLLRNGANPYRLDRLNTHILSIGNRMSNVTTTTRLKLLELSHGFFVYKQGSNRYLDFELIQSLIAHDTPIACKAIEMLPNFSQALKAELNVCMHMAIKSANFACMDTILKVANQNQCAFTQQDWQNIIQSNHSIWTPYNNHQIHYLCGELQLDKITAAFKHISNNHFVDCCSLASEVIQVSLNKHTIFTNSLFSDLLFWLSQNPFALGIYNNKGEYLFYSLAKNLFSHEQFQQVQSICQITFGSADSLYCDKNTSPKTLLDHLCESHTPIETTIVEVAKQYPNNITASNYANLIKVNRYKIVKQLLSLNLEPINEVIDPETNNQFYQEFRVNTAAELSNYIECINIIKNSPFKSKFVQMHPNRGNRIHQLFLHRDFLSENDLNLAYQALKDCGTDLAEVYPNNSQSLLHILANYRAERFPNVLFNQLIDDLNAKQFNFVFGLRDNDGNSILHLLAKNGHIDAIRSFINKAQDENVSLHSTNNRGVSIINFAMEYNQRQTVMMLHREYNLPLPENFVQRQGDINYGQSVHNAAVEKSASESARRLYQRFISPANYQQQFNQWIQSLELQKAACIGNDSLEAKFLHLDKVIQNAQEINAKYMHQSIESAKAQCVDWLKAQDSTNPKIAAIKRQINRFQSNSYRDKASSVTSNQALGLVWLAIHDPMAQLHEKINIMVEDLADRRNTLIQYFYEICRGYNLDDKGQDNGAQDSRICAGGTFVQYMAALNGSHKDVEIRYVNANSIKGKIDRTIMELFNTLSEAEKIEYSQHWDSAHGMPDGFLNRFKDEIKKRIYDHFSVNPDIDSADKTLVENNLELLELIVPGEIELYRLAQPVVASIVPQFQQSQATNSTPLSGAPPVDQIIVVEEEPQSPQPEHGTQNRPFDLT